ncbi:MAG: hypothetical protein M3O46_08715, partial [Myxococcota bacterium]|nr:hypothetical protein [Myxococcota bacterium]
VRPRRGGVGSDPRAQTPVWRPWFDALGKRFRVHRYDSRGCGLSDRADRASSRRLPTMSGQSIQGLMA